MTEIWKDIEGYEGLYAVSNMGRVKSYDKWIERKSDKGYLMPGRMMKLVKITNGYLTVSVRKNGNVKVLYVHRLVAKAFIDNPNGYDEVNHIDENKENNTVDNLEWCNHLYNCNFGHRNDSTRVATLARAYVTDDVYFETEFKSQKEISQKLNIPAATISSCCSNGNLHNDIKFLRKSENNEK